MKKFVAVVGLLAVVAGSASAQGGGGGGMGGGRGTPEAQDSTQLSRLFNGITLNADQTVKAKAIITKAREGLMGMDAVGVKMPVEREDAPRADRLGGRDERGVGQVHRGIARPLHQLVHPPRLKQRIDRLGSSDDLLRHAALHERQHFLLRDQRPSFEHRQRRDEHRRVELRGMLGGLFV